MISRVCILLLFLVCVQAVPDTTDPDSVMLKKVFKQQKKTRKTLGEVQDAVEVLVEEDVGEEADDVDTENEDDIEVPVPTAEYLGCYKDRSKRLLGDLKVTSSSLTVEMCLAMCGAREFKYSGVQHANECFCGNTADFDAYGKTTEEDCWKPCAGNREQVCGGVWRMSVYEMKYP